MRAGIERRALPQQRFVGFELLEAQFKLSDVLIELFRGAPEVHATQSRQLHFELVDFELSGQQRRALLQDELL